MSKLKDTNIPYIYIAGNHDWHYEGIEGTLESLRDKWIEKRLLPLYQGNHPLMAAYDIKGIRFWPLTIPPIKLMRTISLS